VCQASFLGACNPSMKGIYTTSELTWGFQWKWRQEAANLVAVTDMMLFRHCCPSDAHEAAAT